MNAINPQPPTMFIKTCIVIVRDITHDTDIKK